MSVHMRIAFNRFLLGTCNIVKKKDKTPSNIFTAVNKSNLLNRPFVHSVFRYRTSWLMK